MTLAWIIGLMIIGVGLDGAVDAVASSTQRVRHSTVTGVSVVKSKTVSVLPGQTFEDLLTQIRASDAEMDQAAFYLRTYSDQQYVRNYVTLVNRCTALVGTYNADALHYRVAQFLQANLPAHVDQSDVTTDCRQTP